MPFDQGSITCRVCRLPQDLPEDYLQRFAEKAAVPLEYVKDEPMTGWVSGRHLLERRIDEETAIKGGYLHLALRQAQRKIPASLLKAECRMEELALESERERPVGRKEKKRIKEEVSERLLKDMPPQLSGIPMLVDRGDSRLYIGASSDTQVDLFMAHFLEAQGFEPVPLLPDIAAEDLFSVNPDAIPQLNFSPSLPDENVGGSLGQNFLTWLWFFQEARGGVLPRTQLGEFGLMIDGPLVFVAEGAGALESTIRKGLPTVSAEAKAAMMVGKKLKRAKLILARDKNEIWSATIDADTFCFRSLKLPQGEALDPESVFEERVTNLYIFQTVFYQLFQRFLNEMTDPEQAREFQSRAKEWVQTRDEK